MAGLALLLAAPGAGAARSPWGGEPTAYGVSAPQELNVHMSDGVALKADVYWPTDRRTGAPAHGPFPVILAQTPYGKRSSVTTQAFGAYGGNGYFPYLVQRGYVNAVVDVRGTGASGGDFTLFGPREMQDGVELVDWASKLPRSDGRVGTAGFSYVGLNQVFTAARVGRGSPLKAIFPVTTGDDLYRDIAFGGGIPNVDFAATWLALRSTMVASNPQSTPRRALGLAGLDASLYAEVDLGGPRAYEGDFWRSRAPRAYLSRIVRNRIPAFLWSGWFDVYQRGAPLAYAGLQNAWARRRGAAVRPMAPRQRVTGRYQLVMGPWFHDPATLDERFQQAQLAWFDRWLKGRHNGIAATRRPLHAFELGAGRWVDARDYPLAEARVDRLYPGPGGSLGARRPSAAADDSLPWNPARSPCSRELDQWNTGLGPLFLAMAGFPGSPCWSDDRSAQTGALTYTSPPLKRALSIAGPIDATVRLSSTRPEAELVATLEDVAPDGRSYPLTTGALLGSLRALDAQRSWFGRGGGLLLPYHPYTAGSARDLRPGALERLDVEVFPTFARIAAGHRLRLTLASSDTALQPSPVQAQRLAGGVYRIRRGGARGSFVDLPVAAPGALHGSAIDWGRCSVGC